MIKTNIKMRVTPEQSKKVQEICFSNGIGWRINKNNLAYLDKPYLGIELPAIFYRDSEDEYHNRTFLEEIDADLFIRTNGTCEENVILNKGAKSCDMLQSENKELQKKIENLHIALNKKVAKNKNQKEQITLLLKQKEELKRELYYKKANDNITKGLFADAITTLDELCSINDDLELKLKEKDTIISYLESKLK